MKHITKTTGAWVWLCGRGSGFKACFVGLVGDGVGTSTQDFKIGYLQGH